MTTDNKKLIFFLPNIFTALNMACGFAGFIYAIKGNFYAACILIAVGAIFDSVDGRIARLTGTQSSFGEQFDSMSDLISFGMAPAVIFYFKFLSSYGRLGLVLGFIFVLCGALRLARFNANIEKINSDFFQGLPIPGAASALIGYVLLSLSFPVLEELPYLSMAYIGLYSALMISNFPFPSFKQSKWVRKHKKQSLFIIILLLCLLVIYEEVMIMTNITVYVMGSFIYLALRREKLSGVFTWKSEMDDKLEDE